MVKDAKVESSVDICHPKWSTSVPRPRGEEHLDDVLADVGSALPKCKPLLHMEVLYHASLSQEKDFCYGFAMVNLGISSVDADTPQWLFVHMKNRMFCWLDFDYHIKNRPEAANAIRKLCSEFATETTGLVTICGFEDTRRLHRKDRVSKDEPWLPLTEAATPMLRVLANQLEIPGFEVGLHYLWADDCPSRTFLAAIPIDEDDDREHEPNFPPLPEGPLILNPPDDGGGMKISDLIKVGERKLVHT